MFFFFFCYKVFWSLWLSPSPSTKSLDLFLVFAYSIPLDMLTFYLSKVVFHSKFMNIFDFSRAWLFVNILVEKSTQSLFIFFPFIFSGVKCSRFVWLLLFQILSIWTKGTICWFYNNVFLLLFYFFVFSRNFKLKTIINSYCF